MPAGPHRKRVTIQQYTEIADSDGGLIHSPALATVIATRWASVRPMTVNERLNYQQVQAQRLFVVELRQYLSTVTEQMEIVFETRVFQVLGVRHDEMKHMRTLIDCVEIL